MSIFRRRSSSDVPIDDSALEPDEPTASTSAPASVRDNGPWDVTEVDGLGERLDLGAVWVPPIEGLQLGLEVDQATETIQGVQLVMGESAAQVQAFAAPRSGGLWQEIRDGITTSITDSGGTAEEVDGVLGTELRVRMPQQAPDGRTVFAPARFLGIDGPRWFLRAVISGRAAIDDDAATPLLDAVRALVVVRGQQPMAPRELLPLHVPETADAEVAESEDAEDRTHPDLDPFERGPEITEVR